MPKADPWHAIQQVQNIERSMRESNANTLNVEGLDPYWQDLCRLLYAHRLSKDKNIEAIKALRSNMTDKSYEIFINTKIDAIMDHLG